MSRYWQVKTYAGWWEAGPLEMRVKSFIPLGEAERTYCPQIKDSGKPKWYGARTNDRHAAVAQGLGELTRRARLMSAGEKAQRAEQDARWDAQAERDLAAEPPTEVPRGFRR